MAPSTLSAALWQDGECLCRDGDPGPVGAAGRFSTKDCGEQHSQPGVSLAPAARSLGKLTPSAITEAGGGKTS